MKLAVIRSSSIGDVILSTGVLSWMHHQGRSLVWIGSEPTLSLLKESFTQNEFVQIDGVSAKELKSMGVTHCVDLQGSIRSKWLCLKLLLLGVSSTGYSKRRFYRGWLVIKARLLGRTRLVSLSQEVEAQHKLMTQACLKPMGIDLNALETSPRPYISSLSLKAKVPPSIVSELGAGRWICVAPGASYEAKRAPLEVWFSLFRQVRALADSNPDFLPALDIGIVTIGTEVERDMCSQFLDGIDWKGPKINLSGRLNLSQTTSVIGMTDLMLCNDSGPLHIAEAQNISVYAMFGPTVREFGFFPWQPTSQVFESRLGCRPCSKHGSRPCRYGDQLCFETIDINKMATKVLNKLSTLTQQRRS